MENLWGIIAKARGVEINEVFKWNGSKYRINERGLEYYNDDKSQWTFSGYSSEIIEGEGEIEKLPFRPQRAEIYYTIIHNTAIISYHWKDTTEDYERLIAGTVFRTREEVEAYIPTWIERINKL